MDGIHMPQDKGANVKTLLKPVMQTSLKISRRIRILEHVLPNCTSKPIRAVMLNTFRSTF